MNIIFLDVDGPLTYSDYDNKETENIDPEKVKLLKEICDKGNASVIIISSWRGSETYTPKIYHTLRDVLNKYNVPVLGDAPYLPYELEDNQNISETIALTTLEELPHYKFKPGTGRAAEVHKYIQDNNVDNFVILDDEDFYWSDYNYEKHWIQPTWFGNGGLKPEHVTKAINILKGNLEYE